MQQFHHLLPQPALGPRCVLLLLLLLGSPAEATTVLRFDRESPLTTTLTPRHTHQRPRSEPPSPPSPRAPRSLHRRGDSQFEITFSCPDSSPAICQYAQNSFERAGVYISSMITISTPIKVHATFKSFCNNQSLDSCSSRNILGAAAPVAYFPARPTTSVAVANSPLAASWFLYPQALVKQLHHDAPLEYASFDILADFNADIKTWWFKDSPTPIVANQTDFDFVITHELTHGLGWDTSLLSFDQVFTDVASKTTPYVAPSMYFHGSTGKPVADAWTFLTSFDALIKDNNGRAVTDYLTPVQAWWGSAPPSDGDEPNVLTSIISQFEASGTPFSAAAALAKTIIAAPRSLKVNTNTSLFTVDDGKNTGFSSGSSITHLDYTRYENTPDFLMLPYDNDGRGVPLMDLVKKNGGTGVYGPETLQVMANMGWGTGGQPSSVSLTIGTGFQIGDTLSAAVKVRGGGGVSAGTTTAATLAVVTALLLGLSP
ncbi:hypothetical protein HDU87_005601 [Geranomyces variabilis]|uniref:Uncharacterized protein n=1 Tax=Geranomyces variabilis TaxID=109894 RepID=A0AAD5TIY9_9FUNG|nr:hypothetical protein HDU87_005601 [Geranomyces variabilis]